MSYDYDDSTIGEGIIAWLCFTLGVIPVLFYCLYLHAAKGREWTGAWGFLRKTSGLTFLVLALVDIVVAIIIFASVMSRF